MTHAGGARIAVSLVVRVMDEEIRRT